MFPWVGGGGKDNWVCRGGGVQGIFTIILLCKLINVNFFLGGGGGSGPPHPFLDPHMDFHPGNLINSSVCPFYNFFTVLFALPD